MSDGLYKDEGYRLMGAAFEVYNQLGAHLVESIYQAAFEKELGLQGIPYESQRRLDVYYKGEKLNLCFVPDLIVFNEIVVELKAVKNLLSEHESQLINYLALTKKRVGYLINFAHKGTLEWKRFVL